MINISGILCKIFGLDKDLGFLESFKGDWNRFCNSYKPRSRTISDEQFQTERREEPFLPIQVDLGNKFGEFYEIYLKHKFIPDNKFINNLDNSFWKTIQDMHDILGINAYPQKYENDPDAAYNIRWRGTLLISYMQQLSQKPFRYFGVLLLKMSIYLLVPIGLISAIVAIWAQIFR